MNNSTLHSHSLPSLFIFLIISLFMNVSVFAALEKKAVIVALSDLHGALEPTIFKTKKGEEVPWGGSQYFASYIKILKEQSEASNTPVFIIDAGDDFQGTIISNREEGKPVVKFFNYIGLDATILGNHDFDYGPVGEHSVPMDDKEDPQGAIKERIKEAKYPYLAANVFLDNKSGKEERPSWIRPSVMIEKMGVKVGIVGAAEEATPSTTEKRNLKGLVFKHAFNYVVEEAQKLRKQGADFVVLSIHEGAICGTDDGEGGFPVDNTASNDISNCKGELIDLAKQLPEGTFDVLVGGHTHHMVQKTYKNMAIMESFPKGKSLQWAEISKNDKGLEINLNGPERICGKAVLDRGHYVCTRFKTENSSKPVENMKFLGNFVEADKGLLKILDTEFKEAHKIESRVLSKAKVLKTLERSYNDESALGNFVADMMFAYFAPGKVDLAFTNNGGIRDNLQIGAITYGEIYNILPFDNKMAITHLKGKTLRRYIEKGLNKKHSGISWSGMTYESSGGKLLWAKVGKEDLDDEKMYSVGTSDFLATGGGGFDSIPLGAGEGVVSASTDITIRDAMEVGLAKITKDVVPTDYYNKSNPRQNIH